MVTKRQYYNKTIDFLNIDAEDTEYKILKSFNFKKYKPKLICIEIHGRKKEKRSIYKLLKSLRYNKIWQEGYSFIFKQN